MKLMAEIFCTCINSIQGKIVEAYQTYVVKVD